MARPSTGVRELGLDRVVTLQIRSKIICCKQRKDFGKWGGFRISYENNETYTQLLGLFEIRGHFLVDLLLSWKVGKQLIIQILSSEQLTVLYLFPAWSQKQKQIDKTFKISMVSKLILPGEKASRVESMGKGAVEACCWEFRWNREWAKPWWVWQMERKGRIEGLEVWCEHSSV